MFHVFPSTTCISKNKNWKTTKSPISLLQNLVLPQFHFSKQSELKIFEFPMFIPLNSFHNHFRKTLQIGTFQKLKKKKDREKKRARNQPKIITIQNKQHRVCL